MCWYSKQWQNTNLPTVYKENLLFQIHLYKVLPQLKTDYVVISYFSSVEMCETQLDEGFVFGRKKLHGIVEILPIDIS